MTIQSVIAIIILPVPVIHLWLHALLNFWRKQPWNFYIFCALVWIGVGFLINNLNEISLVLFEPSYALKVCGYILVGFGFAAAISSFVTLGYKRFLVWAVLRPESVKQQKFKIGPFRFLPHPAYIGYIFVAVGNFLTSGALYLLLVLAVAFILMPVVIFLEEEEMVKRLA